VNPGNISSYLFKDSSGLFLGGRSSFRQFRRLSDEQIEQITQTISGHGEKKKEKELPLLCIGCLNLITTQGAAIPVCSQHRHTFRNPAGIVYEIGCFSSARGCMNAGEPSVEYTWFPGYSWCYSMCAKCSVHLGWLYQSGDSYFYGLILKRLIGG